VLPSYHVLQEGNVNRPFANRQSIVMVRFSPLLPMASTGHPSMASLSCLNPSWHRHGFANYRQVSKLSPPKYPNPGSGEQYKLAPFQRAGAKLTKRKTAHTQKNRYYPTAYFGKCFSSFFIHSTRGEN
jgi:hypothetical protein